MKKRRRNVPLPYHVCRELVVSVELVNAFKALVCHNVHFIFLTKQKKETGVHVVYVCISFTTFKTPDFPERFDTKITLESVFGQPFL